MSTILNLNDEDNLFDQENFKLLSERALSFREQNGSRFSSKDTELGSSITLLHLSAFLSADDAQLFIFKDERENILIAQSILNFTYAIAIISVLILISLVAFVTTRTFGGMRGTCRQAGIEFLDQMEILAQANKIGEQALELLDADETPTGEMDIVIAPDQMMLQIQQ